MIKNHWTDSLKDGEILYFHNRDGYRNSRSDHSNVGAHIQLQDYFPVWIDRSGDEPVVRAYGFRRKAPMILEKELKFFDRTGKTIEDIGVDPDDVDNQPKKFSDMFAYMAFADNRTLDIATVVYKLRDYNFHDGNIKVMRLIENQKRHKNMTPVEMGTVILHMMIGLQRELVNHNGGDYEAVTGDMQKILENAAERMVKKK